MTANEPIAPGPPTRADGRTSLPARWSPSRVYPLSGCPVRLGGEPEGGPVRVMVATMDRPGLAELVVMADALSDATGGSVDVQVDLGKGWTLYTTCRPITPEHAERAARLSAASRDRVRDARAEARTWAAEVTDEPFDYDYYGGRASC